MNLGILWKHKWMVLTCVVILFGTTSYLVYDQVGGVSEEEQLSVAFYKALWVDADCQKAMNFIPPKYRNDVLKGIFETECSVSKEHPAPRSPVLVIENPEDKNPEYEKLFYIYEPKNDKTYGVMLRNMDGKWQVYQYLLTLNNISYDSLNSQYSGIQDKWKEIPLP